MGAAPREEVPSRLPCLVHRLRLDQPHRQVRVPRPRPLGRLPAHRPRVRARHPRGELTVDNPVEKAARVALVALATARATRFITSDWLGEWWIAGPARKWADRHEEADRREEYERKRANANGPMPAYAHWGSPRDGEPRTWRGKLVKGLDCPFCVGFWIGGLILLGEATIGRSRLRPLWRFGIAMLGLNYIVGHISARIDG
uniref:DUF1360 domain-containing protein n=2 Tax=unclassified bacterial viruses TaxID=12333 RepID=A0AAU7J7F6_9VIRU